MGLGLGLGLGLGMGLGLGLGLALALALGLALGLDHRGLGTSRMPARNALLSVFAGLTAAPDSPTNFCSEVLTSGMARRHCSDELR